MIVTAGTNITNFERKYVLDAVENLSNPKKFNEYVEKFEYEFSQFIGCKYAITVPNGTSALHLGLLALGIGKGDEVILPDMTFVASANAISYTGATPVFVDINRDTWCISSESVESAITKRTKAIMPVWTYGSMEDFTPLLKHNIPIIEDSCPAVGSYWKGKHAGSIGKVGCFSFQGAKVLAIGEGGMMVTSDEDIYKRALKLRHHGKTGKEFLQDEIGYKYIMSNIQAAVGLGQLHHIKPMLDRKREIFEMYKTLNKLYPMNKEGKGVASNMWMSSIIVENRDNLRHYLEMAGIDTRPFFYPITSMGIPEYTKADNPVSYDIGYKGVNLPSAVHLSDGDIRYVINTIEAYSEATK